MKITSKLLGVEELVIKTKVLSQKVRQEGKEAMERSAIIVASRAKENLAGQHGHNKHWISGNLARSIQTKVGWAGLYELAGVIGTDCPYAPHVEALPDGGYLRPALFEVGREALNYLKRQIIIVFKGA